jgi:hypothetical protein
MCQWSRLPSERLLPLALKNTKRSPIALATGTHTDALKRWWANWTSAREGSLDRWERVLQRRAARQFGAGEDVSLHQLTCLLCNTVLADDSALYDERLSLQVTWPRPWPDLYLGLRS